MFPEYDYNFEEQTIEETESIDIARTPKYDFYNQRYVVKDGKIVECTRAEAVQQWIGFLVQTMVGKYRVYDNTDFGIHIDNYIGYKDFAFVASEIEREIEEKIYLNRAIDRIENFSAQKLKDKLTISLAVVLKSNEEVEVSIDV